MMTEATYEVPEQHTLRPWQVFFQSRAGKYSFWLAIVIQTMLIPAGIAGLILGYWPYLFVEIQIIAWIPLAIVAWVISCFYAFTPALVIRSDGTVVRYHRETWLRRDLEKCDPDLFWQFPNGRLIPVVDSIGEDPKPFDCWVAEPGEISSEDMARALVQDAAQELFVSRSRRMAEVVKMGLGVVLAIAILVFIWLTIQEDPEAVPVDSAAVDRSAVERPESSL